MARIVKTCRHRMGESVSIRYDDAGGGAVLVAGKPYLRFDDDGDAWYRVAEVADDDPFGFIAEYARAIADPRLDDGGSQSLLAVLDVALCMGRCRVFRTDPPPDLDGNLNAAMVRVLPGVLFLQVTALESAIHSYNHLPSAHMESEELDDAYNSILHERMDIHCVCASLEEGLCCCASDGTMLRQEVNGIRANVAEAIASLDRCLRDSGNFLATASETNLVRNWIFMMGSVPAWLVPSDG